MSPKVRAAWEMTLTTASRATSLANSHRWQDIKQKLEEAIVSGEIVEGDRLPNEHALAASFTVHRHTIRRALAELAADGLVRIEKGRGTFIETEQLEYRIGRRTRFSENVLRSGLEQHAQLLNSAQEKATAEIAGALGLRRGQQVIVLHTLRHVNGRPTSYASHYVARDRFEGMRERFLMTGSISLALKEFGIEDYLRKTSRVTSRLPSGDEARILSQPRSQPILVINSINVVPQGAPILFSIARMSALRVQLIFDIDDR
ncbi:GntR family phosphonate transport system transcriptional regulator [Bradyrhizobium sp. USDA 4369]